MSNTASLAGVEDPILQTSVKQGRESAAT